MPRSCPTLQFLLRLAPPACLVFTQARAVTPATPDLCPVIPRPRGITAAVTPRCHQPCPRVPAPVNQTMTTHLQGRRDQKSQQPCQILSAATLFRTTSAYASPGCNPARSPLPPSCPLRRWLRTPMCRRKLWSPPSTAKPRVEDAATHVREYFEKIMNAK